MNVGPFIKIADELGTKSYVPRPNYKVVLDKRIYFIGLYRAAAG